MNSAALQHALIALVIVVGIIAVIRFEIFCLKDLAQTDDEELLYLSRSAWIVVIVCLIPIGGIFYLTRGRYR